MYGKTYLYQYTGPLRDFILEAMKDLEISLEFFCNRVEDM